MIFFDPLSTNKIYRREFLDRHGIRFPEGVHYEDSLFSTKVYCLAETHRDHPQPRLPVAGGRGRRGARRSPSAATSSRTSGTGSPCTG